MILSRKSGALFALVTTGVIVTTLLQLRTATPAALVDEPDRAPAASASAAPRTQRVSAAAAKAYAEKRQADALGLLALGRATGDPAWLARALAEHPDDPRVQLERWNLAKTPEEKLSAARALQQAAPDNPLGAYLEATQAFDNRDLGAVARLMVDAEAARSYEAYSVEMVTETQAAFESGGLSAYQAWGAAMAAYSATGFQTINALRQLGDDMGELQHVFVEMGYWDEADFMFERTLALGEQLEGSGLLFESLAGQALQGKLLGSFDPDMVIDDSGTRAGQRLREIRQSQDELLQLAEKVDWTMRAKSMDAAAWSRYLEILQGDGELAATRWLSEQK